MSAALVLHGTGDLRLQDVTTPVRGDGALVRVEAAGVCAADRYLFSGDHPWDVGFPLVPGHEWVGVVEDVEPAAGARWGVQVGDRVSAEVMVPCDRCGSCARGRQHLCREGSHLGSDLPGGWAELLHVPAGARVHRLPGDVAAERAALVEPVSCGVHAVARAGVEPGDTVVVAGLGAIGAAALLAARRHRPRVLVAAVTSPEHARLALALGADAAVDVRGAADPAAALRYGGLGPDVYLEVSGSSTSVRTGLDALAPGGRLVLYGVYRRDDGHGLAAALNTVAEFKELEVRGGHLSPGAWPEAVALVADPAVPLHLLVDDVLPLAEGPRALAAPRAPGPRMRTVLVP